MNKTTNTPTITRLDRLTCTSAEDDEWATKRKCKITYNIPKNLNLVAETTHIVRVKDKSTIAYILEESFTGSQARERLEAEAKELREEPLDWKGELERAVLRMGDTIMTRVIGAHKTKDNREKPLPSPPRTGAR